MRLVVVAAGFHRVRVLGRHHLPSSPRDAPVVVMAPHSSFFDAIAIVCLGAPSVVAKADTARLPFIGRTFAMACVDRYFFVLNCFKASTSSRFDVFGINYSICVFLFQFCFSCICVMCDFLFFLID